MKILFHLGHPAHFHLFKNVIKNLKENGNQISILIKKKDVLEDLLKEENFEYKNILEKGRMNTSVGMAYGLVSQNLSILKYCLKNKQDLLVGCSTGIAHAGSLLGVPSIYVNEDDVNVIKTFAKITFPWINSIIVPEVCDMGKWEGKKVGYAGYNELAYLHPKNFTPNREIVDKYFDSKERYFIIRLAELTAHHDDGVKGINKEIVKRIIELLEPHGKIWITSERKIEKEFEKYRIAINPKDMHNVMSFASFYIGDSQTMAAEAGVLGVPFIRFNDFVGKISYLKELEEKYELGYGIKTNEVDKLYETIKQLLEMPNLGRVFAERRKKMLDEKIDLSQFLTWFLENYPESENTMNENPNYQDKFK